jgi:hypothetical protein
MKGILLLRQKRILVPHLASHFSGVTEISHMALPSQAVETGHVWSILVSNEGHVTLEAETVFLLHLVSHFSVETETSQVVLPAYALQTL